jgi:hypothetical protein
MYTSAVAACKSFLAERWAFPATSQDNMQIFTVLDPITVEKYVVEGGRQAHHYLILQYIKGDTY